MIRKLLRGFFHYFFSPRPIECDGCGLFFPDALVIKGRTVCFHCSNSRGRP